MPFMKVLRVKLCAYYAIKSRKSDILGKVCKLCEWIERKGRMEESSECICVSLQLTVRIVLKKKRRKKYTCLLLSHLAY